MGGVVILPLFVYKNLILCYNIGVPGGLNMAKKNKDKLQLPTFLETFLSIRVQVVTPRSRFHKDETKYNRNDAKKAFRKEGF
jgi:hypothetical protein